MSKKSKSSNKKDRREQKSARKRANYLRFGPKENHQGRRQKKSSQKKFRVKKSSGEEFNIFSFPGPKARKKRQMGFQTKGKTGFSKYPLRPLRKRRHLGSGQIGDMRGNLPATVIGG